MKAGTEGGGAFSLSVVCDSWLEMAFGGRAGASASAVVVVLVVAEVEPAGGGGNSLTICSWRQMRQWGFRGLAHLIQAIQNILQRLGPFCSAIARVRCERHTGGGVTHESSEPSSAAWCRMVSAARGQQGSEGARTRLVPDVMPSSAWW